MTVLNAPIETLHPGIVDPTGLSALGIFADTGAFAEPLALGSWKREVLLEKLEMMLLIRIAEERIGDLVTSGEAKCPCHLGIGQEAVATGVSDALTPNDKVFGAHRSHSHYLALGGDVDQLFAEILGKVTGCSKGMGGSMHLFAPEIGLMGTVPIVGATIPIAVGAGLALKLDKSSHVAVSYFGDGATEEGIFHESLNLAAQHKLPVLFVCENNLYSSHLDIGLRQPSDLICRFALAHRIPSLLVDGNDVLAVADTTRRLLERVRSGAGPAFIEAVTYRWRGHVGPDENIDVGLRRNAADLEAWRARDPIGRLSAAMVAYGMFSKDEWETMRERVARRVDAALSHARSAPYPEPEALHDTVYIQR